MKFNKKGVDIGFPLGETGRIILVLLIFLAAILAVIVIFIGPSLLKIAKNYNFW